MAKNDSDFSALRQQIEKEDAERELIISKSREVIKLTKTVIYAIHRNEIKKAEASKKALDTAFSEVKKLSSANHHGSYKAAAQEYVEAVGYLYYVKNNELIPESELKLDAESYLLGICDLTGELGRRAVNSVIKEDYEEFRKIKDIIIKIYEEMQLFDLRNSELRKKVDSIKYEVKKVEDISLQLKLKGK